MPSVPPLMYGRRRITPDPNSAGADAFGRFRVSNPTSVFESKVLFDKEPLLWDETTAGGASAATHDTTEKTITLSVSADTHSVIRQTFEHFNYQPGRSHFVLLESVVGAGVANVRKRWGYFDGTDGLFFQLSGTTLSAAIRKASSDTLIAQTDWNLDKLDGTGPSRHTLDISKIHIFVIDFEWGGGRVRFGLYMEGHLHYVHEHLSGNVRTSVYMNTPNLPVRWEITSTGGTGSLVQLCSLVLTEGTPEARGLGRYASTNGTHVDANDADELYAVVGIRLKAATLDGKVIVEKISIIAETNDDMEWLLILDPTVAGTFTYADETNSIVQIARGATANTVTDGTKLDGGFTKSEVAVTVDVHTTYPLGHTIAEVPTELVLCVRPLGANANIQGSISWSERF